MICWAGDYTLGLYLVFGLRRWLWVVLSGKRRPLILLVLLRVDPDQNRAKLDKPCLSTTMIVEDVVADARVPQQFLDPVAVELVNRPRIDDSIVEVDLNPLEKARIEDDLAHLLVIELPRLPETALPEVDVRITVMREEDFIDVEQELAARDLLRRPQLRCCIEDADESKERANGRADSREHVVELGWLQKRVNEAAGDNESGRAERPVEEPFGAGCRILRLLIHG